MDLLALMIPPPILKPVEPYGPVVPCQDIDEVLEMRRKDINSAEIQLHQHTDGLWMWATGVQASDRGICYQVGPKWGKFADTRAAALHWAIEEMTDQLNQFEAGGVNVALHRAWLLTLA